MHNTRLPSGMENVKKVCNALSEYREEQFRRISVRLFTLHFMCTCCGYVEVEGRIHLVVDASVLHTLRVPSHLLETSE